MTTRDKMHGGRHLKCRWGKYGGQENGAGHEGEDWNGWEGHRGHRGWGRHHGKDRFRRCRKMILWMAFLFTLMNLIFCCIHKKSIRYRRSFERLSDIHNSAVERNLNEEERNELYMKVQNANWCQQEALRRQLRTQPQPQPAPVANNGQRYSYIPPMEAPLLNIEPMPAPIPPQTAPQPEPQQ